MKHKTAGLDGALLDAAVAIADGWSASRIGKSLLGEGLTIRPYSTDWQHGGPIIERERICVQHIGSPDWRAFTVESATGTVRKMMHAPTPLIAAMRAYVASKFGEEIDLG